MRRTESRCRNAVEQEVRLPESAVTERLGLLWKPPVDVTSLSCVLLFVFGFLSAMYISG